MIIIIPIHLLKMIMHDCHFNFMIMMKNGHIIIIIINYNPDDHDVSYNTIISGHP